MLKNVPKSWLTGFGQPAQSVGTGQRGWRRDTAHFIQQLYLLHAAMEWKLTSQPGIIREAIPDCRQDARPIATNEMMIPWVSRADD